MKIKQLLILLLPFNSYASGINNLTEVKGHFDYDDYIDTITCIESDEYKCSIISTSGIEKTFPMKICSYNGIRSDAKGEIILDCSWWGVESSYQFKYNDEKKDWFLINTLYSKLPMDGPNDLGWHRENNKFFNTWSLTGDFEKINNDIDTSNNDLNQILDDLKNNYIIKDYKTIERYEKLYQKYPISKSNVMLYNNIAYYLEKSMLYDEALFILNIIVKNFPNRTVSYINLGDVHWELMNVEEARKAYKQYIWLMKKTARESRIPHRVHDRAK